MPRPYNLIGQVGSYKGVGDITQAELDAAGVDSSTVYLLNHPQSFGPNMLPEFNFGSVIGIANQGSGQTIGQWIQQNGTFLLVGGLVGLFLFKR